MKAQKISSCSQSITVTPVQTEEEARRVSFIYIPYYQRVKLTPEMFLERWRLAQEDKGFHMLAAYEDGKENPLGFIDFSIFSSLFWSPAIARIDSVHVIQDASEHNVGDALFKEALAIMTAHKVSKVIAVTCAKYQKEVSLLNSHLPRDNNPTKCFYMKILDTTRCG